MASKVETNVGLQFETRSSRDEKVLASDIQVDAEAQRILRPAWVKEQIPLFDVDKLGKVVVNRRKDGKLYVIDGQHRIALMRAIGWGDQKIECEVFTGLTQQEEAAIFLSRNKRINVRTFDKFRIRITAGEAVACDIKRILTAARLVLRESSKGTGEVRAVAALERVYRGAGVAAAKHGPAVLARTLHVIESAWGRESKQFEGCVIEGIAMLMLRYQAKVDQNALIAKLVKLPGGAAGLVGKGRTAHGIHGRTLGHCIAGCVVEQYNRGRSSGKLEGWWS